MCRSGRDGYSPARPLAAVERAVVKHLREILPVLEMVYDDELLGGAAGWRAVLDQVRKTPSWPRSWANFSLF